MIVVVFQNSCPHDLPPTHQPAEGAAGALKRLPSWPGAAQELITAAGIQNKTQIAIEAIVFAAVVAPLGNILEQPMTSDGNCVTVALMNVDFRNSVEESRFGADGQPWRRWTQIGPEGFEPPTKGL